MFEIDMWTAYAALAQLIFFSSFIVQLHASEKKKDSIVTKGFWTMRIIASGMLIFYFLARKDAVFMLSMLAQIMIYLRNISLINQSQTKKLSS